MCGNPYKKLRNQCFHLSCYKAKKTNLFKQLSISTKSCLKSKAKLVIVSSGRHIALVSGHWLFVRHVAAAKIRGAATMRTFSNLTYHDILAKTQKLRKQSTQKQSLVAIEAIAIV